MRKTFKYRIYPTPGQETRLEDTLEECRFVYNHFLEERKTLWEKKHKGIALFTQLNGLTEFKEVNQHIDKVHSQVLQDIGRRVDLAFKAFFRRCKAGEKPGYPRFKAKGRYHSFTYPQNNGCFKIHGNKIKLSKIGDIKIVYHRELQGTPKTCTVSKTRTDKWFVAISCDGVESSILPATGLAVGIDMGLKTFATLSDDNIIENPRFFKQEEKNLIRVYRKQSKTTKDTRERRKANRVIARVHERISNKRNNFTHHASKNVVDLYDIICVEDLSINKMMVDGKKKHLSKAIADASWGLFLILLSFKAVNAGRTFVKVNPAYTTQDCSSCGTRKAMPLHRRMYKCECGLKIDRDLNAAKNILGVGLHTLQVSSETS